MKLPRKNFLINHKIINQICCSFVWTCSRMLHNYAVIKLRNYLTHCLNYDDVTNVTTGRYTTVVT